MNVFTHARLGDTDPAHDPVPDTSLPTSRIPHLLKTLAFLLFFLNAAYAFSWRLDDPFISFRYAHFLLKGEGLVFNPGERVEGYSNLLWTLWSAVGMGIGVQALFWSKLSGLALGIACLFLMDPIAKRILPGNAEERTLGSAFAMLLTGASFWWGLWMMGGLETSLFLFLILLAIHRYLLESQEEDRLPLAALPTGLLLLTRPDGFVWVLALLGAAFSRFILTREKPKDFLVYSLSVLLIGGTYAWFKLAYYGSILPNTYYAKASDVSGQIGDGLRYLANALLISTGLWLPDPSVPLVVQDTLVLPILVAFLVAAGLLAAWIAFLRNSTSPWEVRLYLLLGWAGYVLFILLAGGDWMAGFRFLIPILPLTYLILSSALVLLRQRLGNAIPYACLALLTLSSFPIQKAYAVLQLPWLPARAYDFTCFPTGPYMDLANWIKKEVPKSKLIAISEAGLVPFYCPDHIFLDYLGLTDSHLAHLRGKIHHKTDPDYILGKAPEIMILLGKEDGTWFKGGGAFDRFLTYAPFLTQYSLIHRISRGGDDFLIFRKHNR